MPEAQTGTVETAQEVKAAEKNALEFTFKFKDHDETASGLAKEAKKLTDRANKLQQDGVSFGDKMLAMRAACKTVAQFQTLCSHIEAHNNWGRKTKENPNTKAAPQVWKDYKNIIIQVESKHHIQPVGVVKRKVMIGGKEVEKDVTLDTISKVKTIYNVENKALTTLAAPTKLDFPEELLSALSGLEKVYKALSADSQPKLVNDLTEFVNKYEAVLAEETAGIDAIKTEIAEAESNMEEGQQQAVA